MLLHVLAPVSAGIALVAGVLGQAFGRSGQLEPAPEVRDPAPSPARRDADDAEIAVPRLAQRLQQARTAERPSPSSASVSDGAEPSFVDLVAREVWGPDASDHAAFRARRGPAPAPDATVPTSLPRRRRSPAPAIPRRDHVAAASAARAVPVDRLRAALAASRSGGTAAPVEVPAEIEVLVAKRRRPAYERAVAGLESLRHRVRPSEFAAVVAALRSRHARKRSFLALLDERGWRV